MTASSPIQPQTRQHRYRLTKTQKALLGMLIENGGRGLIYTGSRILRQWTEEGGERGAACNSVTPYFLVTHGLTERVASNRPGPWHAVTTKGREAYRCGFHVSIHTLPLPETDIDHERD